MSTTEIKTEAVLASDVSDAQEYEMVATSPAPSERNVERMDSKKALNRSITWSDVNFMAGDKQILTDVFGDVKQGEVCAVLGPSGAGKSSLLNLLSGRASSSGETKVTGKIFVGGCQIDPVGFRQNISYCMQEDALLATATPREALAFSARMRLPNGTTEEGITKLVNDLLSKLGLDSCADVLIGGPLIKGISGGEKKRVSVGVEVITDPTLLFLDEPTSGLDSFSAFNLVALLKDVAATQCAILCTIHQPSSEVFFLFDKVIYMRQGRIFYFGSVNSVVDYFTGKGYPCPENFNPSDFVMDLCQSEEEGMEKLFMTKSSGSKEGAYSDMVCSQMPLEFKIQRSIGYQAYELLYREAVQNYRDTAALAGRFGVTIFLNLLYSLIFFQAAGKDNGKNENFNAHVGAVSMFMIFCLFGSAQSVMLSFPYERPMFLREYSTGTYGAFAYFVSKCALEIPMTFAQTLVGFIMTYFMYDMQGNFIYLLLSGFSLGMVGNSAAMMIGCAVSDVKNVAELAPLLFVPQILFGGFFVRTSLIPSYIRWCQYLCGMKYSMNLFLMTEFDLELKSCQDSPNARENCNNVLENNDINVDEWYINLIMLFALFLGYRLLGAFILVKTAKKFY